MRVMNTLYVVSHRAKVSVSKRNLVVKDPERGTQRVPIETVDGVVLLGVAQVSSQALELCVDKGVRVVSLRRNGRVRFSVGGCVSGNVHLRLRQYEVAADPEKRARLARRFVAGKLQNCRRMLERWAWDASDPARTAIVRHREAVESALRSLGGVTDGDRIRGIEGDASRRYFAGLGVHLSGEPVRFSARSRRPPRDPFNALLSFCYGLVEGEMMGALESVGLDPQLGFLHGPRSGRSSLALDLLEEFRPAHADRFCVRLVRRRQVGPGDFVYTPGGACYLSDEGRRTVLGAWELFREMETPHLVLDRRVPRWSIPFVQATVLARHLRGDLGAYPPYLMAG